MLIDKDEYLEIFIEHFTDFIEDVALLYSNDDKVQLLKEGMIWSTKNNKKRVINAWKQYVCDNFREQINNNDYKFFTDHADWNTVITHKNKDLIMPKLMELRESIKNLDITNKLKALKYVENLVKLCDLYNS